MLDLFGRRRRQEMLDKAYAEFVSKNYSLASKYVNQLIDEGTKNFHVYNLSAQINLALGNFHLAFRDAISSTNLAPSIEKNPLGYEIRNGVTQELRSGRIKIDLFELLSYFNLENVIQLFIESTAAGILEIQQRNSRFFPGTDEANHVRFTYIALKYLAWVTNEKVRQTNNPKYNSVRLQEFIHVLNTKIALYEQKLPVSTDSHEYLLHFTSMTLNKLQENQSWENFGKKRTIPYSSLVLNDSMDHYEEYKSMLVQFIHFLYQDVILNPLAVSK